MLKKMCIALSVLGLFVLLISVHAKTVNHELEIVDYINPLAITWMQPVEVLEDLMNEHYVRPTNSIWKLEFEGNNLYSPYYMIGTDKYKLPILFYFSQNKKLTSFRATYDARAYKNLIERTEKDFKTGGFVDTSKWTHHTYEKEFEKKGYKIVIDIRNDKISKVIKFESAIKKIPKKEKSNEQETIKGSGNDLFSASRNSIVWYCLLAAGHVNR